MSHVCPPDQPEPVGTQCHASTGPCDPSATSTGRASPARTAPPRRTCRAAGADAVRSGGRLHGVSGACKPYVSPEGTACSADTFRCTSDTCNGAGTCVTTRIPDNQACPGDAAAVCCGGQNASAST